MNRGDCRMCGKPLIGGVGPVVMDRDGLRYHFACWCQKIDALAQTNRELREEHRSKLDSLQVNLEETRALTRDMLKNLPGGAPVDAEPEAGGAEARDRSGGWRS